jgi:tetratricopeptide (TPR) repeat protein
MMRKLIIPYLPAKTSKALYLAIQLLSIVICFPIISCHKPPKETSLNLEKIANEYFNNDNYQIALEAWSKILDIKPESSSVYEKIGDCYDKMAKYNQALQAYQEATHLQPNNWLAIYKTAKIQLAMMDLYMAEKNWEKVKNHINNFLP